MDQRPQKVDCFPWIYDMTKTAAEYVCMYFILTIRMTWPRPRIHLFACIFMFAKSKPIKDEDHGGNDNICPYHIRRKDTKDTVRRYIFWFRRWRRTAVNITANDGACWVGARTSVIDDRLTSIGNDFDRGSAGLGKITFFNNLTFSRLPTDLHANYY